MKRNEMLDLISNTVLNKDTGFHLSLHEASTLLTQLENIGMKLPETGADVPYYITNMHASSAPLEISMSEALAMPEPKSDVIAHPKHYNQGKIEVIEFIEDKKLNYHKGNAIKYISRAGIKNKDKEIEDLRKAIWYLQREIEQLIAKNENREAVKPNDMRK